MGFADYGTMMDAGEMSGAGSAAGMDLTALLQKIAPMLQAGGQQLQAPGQGQQLPAQLPLLDMPLFINRRPMPKRQVLTRGQVSSEELMQMLAQLLKG